MILNEWGGVNAGRGSARKQDKRAWEKQLGVSHGPLINQTWWYLIARKRIAKKLPRCAWILSSGKRVEDLVGKVAQVSRKIGGRLEDVSTVHRLAVKEPFGG